MASQQEVLENNQKGAKRQASMIDDESMSED